MLCGSCAPNGLSGVLRSSPERDGCGDMTHAGLVGLTNLTTPNTSELKCYGLLWRAWVPSKPACDPSDVQPAFGDILPHCTSARVLKMQSVVRRAAVVWVRATWRLVHVEPRGQLPCQCGGSS